MSKPLQGIAAAGSLSVAQAQLNGNQAALLCLLPVECEDRTRLPTGCSGTSRLHKCRATECAFSNAVACDNTSRAVQCTGNNASDASNMAGGARQSTLEGTGEFAHHLTLALALAPGLLRWAPCAAASPAAKSDRLRAFLANSFKLKRTCRGAPFLSGMQSRNVEELACLQLHQGRQGSESYHFFQAGKTDEVEELACTHLGRRLRGAANPRQGSAQRVCELMQ